MGARVLITGATGQTGSFLAETLLRSGWDVHGLGRPEPDVPATFPLHHVDIRDHAGIARLVGDLEPSAIVNLAAVSSVAQSWRAPVETSEVNGLAVANLLQLVRERATTSPIRFVQASSAEIFGSTSDSPQTEATPIAPVNPYGVAKASAHLLTRSYRSAGLHCSNAILYNHESVRRPSTFVTRKVTRAAARIAAGLQTELVLGDLEIVRDWGWAGDHAEAIALMLQVDDPDDFIVATGEARSLRDLVATAFRAAGVADWERFVRTDPAFVRPTETVRMVGDASKLRRVTGWQPTVSFEDMVAEMVEWDRPQQPAV